MTQTNQYRRAESVLVLVYTRASEVLLMRRLEPADFWQSVTGGLEENETAANAAQRELFEETGLQAALTDHQCSSLFEIKGVWRQRYHPEQTHNREHLFSVELDAPAQVLLNADEHAEYVWLPAEQAMQRVSSPTNRQAIEDIALTAQYR